MKTQPIIRHKNSAHLKKQIDDDFPDCRTQPRENVT
jgi:hypothetical protein